MLAVSISESDARLLLNGVENHVSIAAINSPESVTLSGDNRVLEELYNILSIQKSNVFKTWLRIENAFHSQQMERFHIREDLMNYLTDIKGYNVEQSELFDINYLNTYHYSTVTGNRIDNKNFQFNAQYWWNNIRQTVLFSHGI
ncbi:unnamed protein product, partial [Rotaria sp. Silwood1]